MSTKVAINCDWGGFNFSPEMIIWLASRNMPARDASRLERHDPLLIECVEACKDVGDIQIVEIDDDRYFIIDYDGVETVYVPSNLPWIKVTN